MKLTSGEKLILVMLSDIQNHLKVQGNVDPELILSSIYNDQTWALRWEYSSLFNIAHEDADDPSVVTETCKILDMYRLIDSSYAKLPPTEQGRVKQATAPYDDYLQFQGFDGNHDPHISVLNHLTDRMKRYDERKQGVRNSHSQSTLPKYRRMLPKFERSIDPYPRNGLTADQLIEIIKD